ANGPNVSCPHVLPPAARSNEHDDPGSGRGPWERGRLGDFAGTEGRPQMLEMSNLLRGPGRRMRTIRAFPGHCRTSCATLVSRRGDPTSSTPGLPGDVPPPATGRPLRPRA